MPGDQWNWRLNGGASDFNREHRFVVSGVYDLPKFVANDNGAKWLLNDWQVAGIAVFQSGLPFSIIDTNGTSIISRANFASGTSTRAMFTPPVVRLTGQAVILTPRLCHISLWYGNVRPGCTL